MHNNTIVVGYDGTAGARAALAEALIVGKDLGAKVVAVFSFSAPRIGSEAHDLDLAIEERGKTVLQAALHQAQAAGTECELAQRNLDPVDGLLDVAQEHDARMIVVGSYGERPLKGVLLGSTPHKLLHLSERPVLVVRIEDE